MKESEIRQKIKEGYIRARTIIEIAGFPREHISKTLDLLAKKLKEENWIVIELKKREPKKISEKMWSAFVEMEFLTRSLSDLLALIYDYMPSSIEIIEPEDPISDDPVALTNMLNDLIAKLHSYSATIKRLTAENTILKRTIQKLRAGDQQG